MKKIINAAIIIVAIAISSIIIYAGVKIGIPFLNAQTTYTQNLPTIELQQETIDSLTFKVDSLDGVITQIINATNLKGMLVNDLSKRNESLQKKYDKLADIFSRIPESELDAFINSFNQ